MLKPVIYTLVAAAMLTAAGCSEITGFLTSAHHGTLTFRYAGAESGAFSARGARPDDWGTRTHAAGLRLDSPSSVNVFALSLRRWGLADQFFLLGTVVAPGTYLFSEDHHEENTIYAEFALDVSVAANTARAIYVLTSGSMTLEPERGGRIRGRFQGSARLLNGTAVIQITDGRFDVPNNLPRPVD